MTDGTAIVAADPPGHPPQQRPDCDGRGIDSKVASTMVAVLTERLRHLVDIGLDYLSFDRETDTLSGGESQRSRAVASILGS